MLMQERILNVLYAAEGKPLTRRQVARRCDLKKTPYLVRLLEGLVAANCVTREIDIQSYPSRYVYFITDENLRQLRLFDEVSLGEVSNEYE